MAKKSKGNGHNAQKAPLSPDKYIMKCARNLPVERSLMIDDEYDPIKVAFIIRAERGGLFSCASYLIDTWCRGVYDTFFETHLSKEDVDRLLDHYDGENMKETDYAYVHNLVLGAVEFAEEAGIAPHKDFKVSQYMLAEDTDDIPLIEIEFGIDGKHALDCSNKKEYLYNKSILEKNLAPDQYILLNNEYEKSALEKIMARLADTEVVKNSELMQKTMGNATLSDNDFLDLTLPQQTMIMMALSTYYDDDFSDNLKERLTFYRFKKEFKNYVADYHKNEDEEVSAERYELILDLLIESYFNLLDEFQELTDNFTFNEDTTIILELYFLYISAYTSVTVQSMPEDITSATMTQSLDNIFDIQDKLFTAMEELDDDINRNC